MATDKIVHVGDNWKGDIAKAKAAGLTAVRFDPLYDQRYDLFPITGEDREQLSQIGRIWDGFCTQAVRLWHAAHPQIAADFFVKLGFEVSGPLAVMMAMHTRKHADQVGARRIVFMARDGRIIKEAFEALYADEIAAGRYVCDYVHLSRATVVPGTLQHPLSSNDLYFLIEGLHLGQKSVAYFLQKAGLSERDPEVARIVSRHFAGVETVPVWADLDKMLAMLTELSQPIHEANRTHRDNFRRYLDQLGLLTEEKFVVVDVGWLLNIQSRLEKFIRSTGSKTTVTGCYVGSRDRINKSLKHESLLFDGGDPHLYAQFIGDNTTLFEILFSARKPRRRRSCGTRRVTRSSSSSRICSFRSIPNSRSLRRSMPELKASSSTFGPRFRPISRKGSREIISSTFSRPWSIRTTTRPRPR